MEERMRVATLIAVAVLMAAPAALAQTEPAAAPETAQTEAPTPAQTPASEATITAPLAEEAPIEAPEAAAAAEPELVCRSAERSESRLRSRRERVCRTQAEWDALQAARTRGGGAQADNN
jgi:hypothetical protein